MLTDEQRQVLDARMSFAAANLKKMSDAREKRDMHQQKGRLQAKAGDARFIAGCMLYWAEGSKKRNPVVFVNSDPEMMMFFVDFLRDYYRVQNAEITLSITAHVTSEISLEQTVNFWLECLALDSSCLRKNTMRRGNPDGKLKYGIAVSPFTAPTLFKEFLERFRNLPDSTVLCGFSSEFFWPIRLGVRPGDSQSPNGGSSPPWATVHRSGVGAPGVMLASGHSPAGCYCFRFLIFDLPLFCN